MIRPQTKTRPARAAHVKPYREFTRLIRSGNRSAAGETARALANQIEALAIDLLGQPQAKHQRTWRYGRRESLVINVAGPRRGHWFSFEEAKGGDALDLIAWVRRLTMKEALAHARAWLGA